MCVFLFLSPSPFLRFSPTVQQANNVLDCGRDLCPRVPLSSLLSTFLLSVPLSLFQAQQSQLYEDAWGVSSLPLSPSLPLSLTHYNLFFGMTGREWAPKSLKEREKKRERVCVCVCVCACVCARVCFCNLLLPLCYCFVAVYLPMFCIRHYAIHCMPDVKRLNENANQNYDNTHSHTHIYTNSEIV